MSKLTIDELQERLDFLTALKTKPFDEFFSINPAELEELLEGTRAELKRKQAAPCVAGEDPQSIDDELMDLLINKTRNGELNWSEKGSVRFSAGYSAELSEDCNTLRIFYGKGTVSIVASITGDHPRMGELVGLVVGPRTSTEHKIKLLELLA